MMLESVVARIRAGIAGAASGPIATKTRAARYRVSSSGCVNKAINSDKAATAAGPHLSNSERDEHRTVTSPSDTARTRQAIAKGVRTSNWVITGTTLA